MSNMAYTVYIVQTRQSIEDIIDIKQSARNTSEFYRLQTVGGHVTSHKHLMQFICLFQVAWWT